MTKRTVARSFFVIDTGRAKWSGSSEGSSSGSGRGVESRRVADSLVRPLLWSWSPWGLNVVDPHPLWSQWWLEDRRWCILEGGEGLASVWKVTARRNVARVVLSLEQPAWRCEDS